MDLKKYRKLFLEEARSHLESLDREIVQLESSGGRELLDSIFRHAHSIKGMAASMGFEPIVELAHALEDLMDGVRTGGQTAGSPIIDLLLEGKDALTELVGAVEREETLSSEPALVARLRGQKPPEPPAAEPEAPSSQAAPAAVPPLATAGGTWIVLKVDPAAALGAARAFQAARLLENLADAFDPPVADLRGGKFSGSLRVHLREAPADELLTRLAKLPDIVSVEAETPGTAPEPEAVREQPAKPAKIEMPSQIRIDTAVLDRFVDMVGELLTVNNQIREVSRSLFSEELVQNVEALGRITGDLYQQVLQARMVPFAMLSERLPRVVRDVAHRLGKEVRLNLEGNDVEIDRSVMEHLTDPLLHLVRNAVDHGLEAPQGRTTAGKPAEGSLTVRARRSEGSVVIEVDDDGAGIATEKVLARAVERRLVKDGEAERMSENEIQELLFRPGFSTADKVSDVSGRGVGLDVVKNAIEGVGGEIQIRSSAGAGTTFRLRVPAQVAILPVFLVRAGEQSFALPIAKVTRARWIRLQDVQEIGGRQAVLLDGAVVPYYNLARLLGIQESFFETEELLALEFERDANRALIGVEAFLEERDVYLKSAPRPLDRLRGLLGVTLVRGVPVYVLDPGMMVWHV